MEAQDQALAGLVALEASLLGWQVAPIFLSSHGLSSVCSSLV